MLLSHLGMISGQTLTTLRSLSHPMPLRMRLSTQNFC